jgi:DNA-binding transcriptional ArsR family regulator
LEKAIMANRVSRKDEAEQALRMNEKKWTKPLMDAGWTAIPAVIIERQAALGLDALDVNILLHLANYWWTEDNKPHPSKGTIAKAVGVDPRTVQRHIAQMEAGGLIRREERRISGVGSRTNLYHFDGLIKEARPFADEKLAERRRREQEDKERPGRKGHPHLKVVSNTDDE